MSSLKRFLFFLSIGVFLLAGLIVTSSTMVSSTAFASGCNTVATGDWSNNCQVSQGNISNFVYAIQQTIKESGTGCSTTIDGNFGPGTFKTVECFQKAKHLTIDGVVGPQTWKALHATLVIDPVRSVEILFHGKTSSVNDFFESRTTSEWTMLVKSNGRTCTINLSSPC